MTPPLPRPSIHHNQLSSLRSSVFGLRAAGQRLASDFPPIDQIYQNSDAQNPGSAAQRVDENGLGTCALWWASGQYVCT